MQNDGVQPGSEVHASLAPCSPPSGVWVGLVERCWSEMGVLAKVYSDAQVSMGSSY